MCRFSFYKEILVHLKLPVSVYRKLHIISHSFRTLVLLINIAGKTDCLYDDCSTSHINTTLLFHSFLVTVNHLVDQ